MISPRRKAAWEKVAGREAGARFSEEAGRLFNRVDASYRNILGRISTTLVAILSKELDEVLSDYVDFKRAAAVLDFEDLLQRARTLVRNHDAVRRALGVHYRYIFVDEFQDTDPVQAEILFLIGSDAQASRWDESSLRSGALFLVGDPKQSIYQFRGANVGSYSQARATIKLKWPENIIQITANFRSRPDILAHVNRCFEATLRSRPTWVCCPHSDAGSENSITHNYVRYVLRGPARSHAEVTGCPARIRSVLSPPKLAD